MKTKKKKKHRYDKNEKHCTETKKPRKKHTQTHTNTKKKSVTFPHTKRERKATLVLPAFFAVSARASMPALFPVEECSSSSPPRSCAFTAHLSTKARSHLVREKVLVGYGRP